MTLRVFALALVLVSWSGPVVAAQSSSIDGYLATLTHNVVRVRAAGSGFGFIVGLRGGELLIATARHTLGDDWDAKPEVCFAPRGEVCRTSTVVYWADPIGNQPALDLVILAVPDPGSIMWRPDVEANAAVGDDVWVIGRSSQWWVSPEPGRVAGRDSAARQLQYRDLAVAAGVSGAPIISRRGIVAMHLQETRSDQEARGLDLMAILERVTERVGGSWVLLAPSDCRSAPAESRELSGRTFVVHLDPSRPAAALRVIAALHCAGVRTMPHLVVDPASWQGDGVVYGAGDLRTGRAIQRLLASLIRLETRLGSPTADAELWVR